VPVLHFLVYKLTGAFVVHSNYIVSAFIPSAIFWSTIVSRTLQTPEWKRACITILFLATAFQTVTGTKSENWRRAINLINVCKDSRNKLVLIQSGFYENAHPELLSYPLLSGPGIAYPVEGLVVAIPSNLSKNSKIYLEKIIEEYRLEEATDPVMIIARSPSWMVASALAERLGRKLTSLEIEGTIVFELY
jgi:hypothetical protein